MCSSCTNNTLSSVTLESSEAVEDANYTGQSLFNNESQADGTFCIEDSLHSLRHPYPYNNVITIVRVVLQTSY
jgi:hypothetical protein